MQVSQPHRQLPVGAELLPGGGVHFRVWAPLHERVTVLLESGPGAPATLPLHPEPGGYHSGEAAQAAAGTRYRFTWEGDDALYPDPASRWQPEGPHGPSAVVDPAAYDWGDAGWPGVSSRGQVLYEMHVGTFTPEGTWAAAAEQLPHLAALGVTVLEVMPVAEFSGRFGWGYDGVNLFAPTRLYGTPDDFRRFVDRAHAEGLGVILDVVYNHLGPDGNYLGRFSDSYFTRAHETDWGEALNFHGHGSGPVREYFLSNATYWIREYHLDGLRLDATQNIYDLAPPPEHILTEITAAVREAAGGRDTYVISENEPQEARLVRPPARDGFGMDALWNDDFHHAAIVALTGRKEAYYSDYLGNPQEFVSCAKWGFLYQGQRYLWQEKRRGTPSLDLPPHAFVCFLQNHDQVANSVRGDRIHRITSPGRLRAMTALLLLGPSTPLLFMGQEFAASSPFLYFADHEPELARAVSRGRKEFLQQFPSLFTGEMPDPSDPDTFARCTLDLRERETHAEVYALHRDLLRLRREDAVITALEPRSVDGAVLGGDAFALRYFGGEAGDRLLLVNLGRDLHYAPAPEPLLASPHRRPWRLLWSSEDPKYAGTGTPDPESPDGGWQIPGESALLLTSGD